MVFWGLVLQVTHNNRTRNTWLPPVRGRLSRRVRPCYPCWFVQSPAVTLNPLQRLVFGELRKIWHVKHFLFQLFGLTAVKKSCSFRSSTVGAYIKSWRFTLGMDILRDQNTELNSHLSSVWFKATTVNCVAKTFDLWIIEWSCSIFKTESEYIYSFSLS